MATVSPYLSFNGNCEEAFNFYKSILGGKFCYLGRYKEMPNANSEIPKELENKIMHISLQIDENTALMGADICEGFGDNPALIAGNNFSICITAKSENEAKRIFTEISAGGKVTLPLEKQFWGALFGTCVDKFGVAWMVDFMYS